MLGLPFGMAHSSSVGDRESRRAAARRAALADALSRPAMPQQRLYFLPLPQGQGSLRPVPRASAARRSMTSGASPPRLRMSAIRRMRRSVWAKNALSPAQSQLRPGSPSGVTQDAVLGALAVAGEEVLAGAAEGGQRRPAWPARRRAAARERTRSPTRRLHDVAEQVRAARRSGRTSTGRRCAPAPRPRRRSAAGCTGWRRRARRPRARRRRTARTSRRRRGAPTRRRSRSGSGRSRRAARCAR